MTIIFHFSPKIYDGNVNGRQRLHVIFVGIFPYANYWLSSEKYKKKKKDFATFKHFALVSNGRERWVLVIYA